MKKTQVLTVSAGQKPLELTVVGDSHLPKVLLLGGVHGDEPEGADVVHDFLNHIDPFISKMKMCALVLPSYNPDGLSKNQRTNDNGVDLNRNFPSSDWSNEHRAPRYYPGAQPKSEPETKALVKLLLTEKPVLVVHFHTYIPQVNYTGKRSIKWAEFLAKDFGHPVTHDIGYPTPGSLGQYCDLDLKIPCVCVELPEKVERNVAWKMIGLRLIDLVTHDHE
jgi:protein MpaA